VTDDDPDPPNVLLLVADSLRYDAVAGDDVDTPALDRLAEEGVAFTRCIAQGISTAPSMTALLTGRYPLDYGGHWYLADDQPTMAGEFRANGYATGAIHSNPNVSRLRNFHRGFDYFEENVLPVGGGGLLERLPDRVARLANELVRIATRTPYTPASEVNDDLATWVAAADRPWFLWTQYMDTHGPYLPGDAFSYRNKLRAERLWRKAAVEAPGEVTDAEHEELYDNYRREVAYLDAEVGAFLDQLREEGVLEETIVVFVADHGDEFREHGQYGHGNLPYEELVHVPLLVRLPESMDVSLPGEVDVPVRCVDVLPTVLDAVGADVSDAMAERMVGRSVLGEEGDPRRTHEVAVTEKEVRGGDALRFGFRDDRWTYVHDGTEDRELLYDREADPGETTDVSEEYPDVLDRLRDHLRDRLDAIEATGEGVETPEIDPREGVQERLLALGYRE
jgi:arylsulfatase A-like enzyme